MQNVKDYEMNVHPHSTTSQSQQHNNNSRCNNNNNSNNSNSSVYSLQFQHESSTDNSTSQSSGCLDSNTSTSSRSINSCIPLGQAFPQMIGGITEFRKNLMVTMQNDASSRDVLQSQGMLCVPSAEVSHMPHSHQPNEQLERQRQRNRLRMKNLRLDPEFRAQERLRQRQRMFLKRQDPQFREKERILQRVRVREKRNMIRALESGNGLLERLAVPSAPSRTGNSVPQESSSLNPSNGALVAMGNGSSGGNRGTSNNSSGGATGGSDGGGPSQTNGSLTLYGTLVDGSQLGQHLLLPNNFLMGPHNDLHHLHHHHHHHNGDANSPECPGLHRGCPSSFNFEMCRNNMMPNCKVCMKLYKDLSKHARGHKRNHRCNTCGRQFRLNQHLKGHMKTHGDKTLACPHCPYKTCYNFALNRHVILKHSRGQGQANSALPPPLPVPPLPPSQHCQQHQLQQPLDATQPLQLSKCTDNGIS